MTIRYQLSWPHSNYCPYPGCATQTTRGQIKTSAISIWLHYLLVCCNNSQYYSILCIAFCLPSPLYFPAPWSLHDPLFTTLLFTLLELCSSTSSIFFLSSQHFSSPVTICCISLLFSPLQFPPLLQFLHTCHTCHIMCPCSSLICTVQQGQISFLLHCQIDEFKNKINVLLFQ